MTPSTYQQASNGLASNEKEISAFWPRMTEEVCTVWLGMTEIFYSTNCDAGLEAALF